MSVAVREYTDAAQLIADAKARRAMFYGAASAPVVMPTPVARVAKPIIQVKPLSGGPRWSERDVAKLRQMIAAGASTEDLALRFNRSEVAIYRKAEALGIKVVSPFRKPGKQRRREPLPVLGDNFSRDWAKAERAALALPNVIEKTIAVVSVYTGVSRIDILSQRRIANLALARHIVCWLLRHQTLLTLAQIGRRVGKRDHSTITHGVSKIEATMDADPAFASDMRQLADIVRDAVRQNERLARSNAEIVGVHL